MGASLIKGSLPDLFANMAEANSSSESCKCASNSSQSSSTCHFCQTPSSSSTSQPSEADSDPGPSTSSAASVTKRTFRNLSISCRKSKSKEKSEKSSKSKLSWTLRWRLKSPQAASSQPLIDLARFNPAAYPIEDRDEAARRARAREIAEGIEVEIESLPACYRLQSDVTTTTPAQSSEEDASAARQLSEASAAPLPAVEGSLDTSNQQHLSPSIIEGLTVLLHRSLAISMDSQRAWNILTHGDLHFLVQHFHWHQHQHGPQVVLTTHQEIPC